VAESIDKYAIDENGLRLRDAMDNILSSLESVFQSYNVPLPTRRFWTIGETPAVDCEQAVVTFLQLYLGTPGDDAQVPQDCNAIKSMVVQIRIARKASIPKSGNAPAPETIQNDASWSAVDAMTIMDNLAAFDYFSVARPTVIATATSNGFQGGYFVTEVQLTLQVP
jgi:hypothetical protein